MRIGLLAILVGVVFLLKNLGYVNSLQWGIVWPILVIYVGIAMVGVGGCWRCGSWHGFMNKSCDCDESPSKRRVR